MNQRIFSNESQFVFGCKYLPILAKEDIAKFRNKQHLKKTVKVSESASGHPAFICSTKKLDGGFKYLYFHPYLGKISNLTNIFQMC